jgi:quinol monooxygenase YgiN
LLKTRCQTPSPDTESTESAGSSFRLLRDTEDPGHFVSITGPWRGTDHFQRVRDSAALQEWLDATQELLESGEIDSYELVVEIS